MTINLDSPVFCTSFRTKQFSRLVARVFDMHLAKADLKTTQFTLLTHIKNMGPISPGLLADRMGLDASTVTRNLQTLITGQLIELTGGRDARSRAIRLTSLGASRLASALPHWESAQSFVNETIGVNNAQALHSLLHECTQKLEAVHV